MKLTTTCLPLLLLSYSVMAQEELEAIQVINHGDDQSLIDFVPSVSTLKGDALRKRLHPTLGDTLQHEAGVTSTQFGPNASRPVIRGLDGPRIKVLQNGLSILDASTQSVDHAVPIEPLLIDQVEIVRGPMSLLYGASAVGGVVNIVTNRVHSHYEEGAVTEILAQGETVNNGISSSARLDVGKNRWMFHVDGSVKNLQNQEIPGFARSRNLRLTDPEDPEPKGELPNSGNRQDSLGLGLTKFFDSGFLGVSFSHIDNVYGVVVEEDVTINLLQNRFELIGEMNAAGDLFHKYRLRSAFSDYAHSELEGREVGTQFENKGNETRIEALNRSGKLQGVSGVQTQYYDFSAEGEEAYLPPTENTQYALFTFQDYTLDPESKLSFGARIEQSQVERKSTSELGPTEDFAFTGFNGSLGYLRKLNRSTSGSFNYSYTERAPNFQELLALGEHLATGSFDRGDRGLGKEKAHSWELSFKQKSAVSQMNLNFYSQIFKDYIALGPTGAVEGDLDVFQYAQVDAIFYGFDFDGRHRIYEIKGGQLNLISRFDFVRGKNTDDGVDLPRIAPPRALLGIELEKENWHSDLEVQYVAHQTKTAPEERATDDYTLVNIGTRYSFMKEASKLQLYLRVRNIFDVTARNHVSFIKDRAPLPGRNFVAGIQYLF